MPHELLAGFVAAVDYVDSLGWDAIRSHETALGERFLAGLPDGVDLYGLRTMSGRVPTFCFNIPGRSPEAVAIALAERDLAVWHGNYYALATMSTSASTDGAVRAGSSTTTPRTKSTGSWPGSPSSREAASSRRPTVSRTRDRRHSARARATSSTFFNRGQTNPELYPEVEKLHGDRDGELATLAGRSGTR